MQLHPREQFVITRQLQNSYITGTFYVRAVIRNAKTDTTLQTYNLTDKGSGRFTKAWQVPADPSGQGFYVSIVTSVYSDSGYTTKDQNYGDEEQTYLIQERYVFNPNYPIATGQDIDYKRIKKMVDEAVRSVSEKTPTEPTVITVTKEIVKEVRVPEVKIVETQKSQDFSSIIKAINAVGKKIDDKPVTEIPEPKEVDLVPLMKKLDQVAKDISSQNQALVDKVDSIDFEVKLVPKLGSVEDVPPKESKISPMQDHRITRLMQQP